MIFDPKKYSMKYNHLYEILATTVSYDPSRSAIIPNSASMGIRLMDTNRFVIKPYPNTQTFRNLKRSGLIIINLIEDVYLFALASLKEREDLNQVNKFPLNYYKYIDFSKNKIIKEKLKKILINQNFKIPYVKQAWGIFVCNVINKRTKIRKSQIGDVRLTEFELEVIYEDIFSNSFKFFNRAENLALEMIILATRLKVADDRKNKDLKSEIYNQILAYKAKLNRFSKNKSANKTLELIETYIQDFVD
ncbi:MAG: DUF447 family protein [Promethearchaeota archaeon]|nr:MAG: DUF447 family protein [Candidatus Lokiarchaeota archaeon]